MLKPLLTAGLLLAATASSALAQVPASQVRAANLARMEAERLNGGLSNYFTASCMHRSGGGDCLVEDNANGYLFNFLGGAPLAARANPGWATGSNRSSTTAPPNRSNTHGFSAQGALGVKPGMREKPVRLKPKRESKPRS